MYKDHTQPLISEFTGESGVKVPIPEKPRHFIKLLITKELLQYFIEETNRYAEQEKEGN